MTAYIRLLRPHQYVKNVFVLLPLLFAQRADDPSLVIKALLTALLFCAASSSSYILNDLRDRAEDREHPTKRLRPLAHGDVSVPSAMFIMGALCLVALGGSYLLNTGVFIIIALYLVMNVAYSLKLKHVAIIDIVIIGMGFVMRVLAGSQAVGVKASMWIILLTFLLALFLALAKRRDDVLLFFQGKNTRRNIDGYSQKFIDSAMDVMAPVVIMSYIFYTISPDVQQRLHSDKLYLTVAFVIMGILRYLQITIVEQKSGSPTDVVLKDRFLQGTILGWLITLTWILYL